MLDAEREAFARTQSTIVRFEPLANIDEPRALVERDRHARGLALVDRPFGDDHLVGIGFCVRSIALRRILCQYSHCVSTFCPATAPGIFLFRRLVRWKSSTYSRPGDAAKMCMAAFSELS